MSPLFRRFFVTFYLLIIQIFSGIPHSSIFSLVSAVITDLAEKFTLFPSKFRRMSPFFPIRVSLIDLEIRFFNSYR